MQDYLEIGSSPAAEQCVQVGEDNYQTRSRMECKIFIKQIRRQLGAEPSGAFLRVRSNPHDFGSYQEVACYFKDDMPDAVEYAYRCESEVSEIWDEEARKELRECGLM